MTYAEYKENGYSDSSNPFILFPFLPRAASPVEGGNNSVTLQAGEWYLSDPFSLSGWRFAERSFRAAPDTGNWLLWAAFGDGGVVGSSYEAWQTYSTGQSIGRAKIEEGQSQYVNGNGGFLLFYTYNPIPGSRYYVKNT